MADLDSTRATPLHPGVDAQSWLGFEQRIQLRRFDALIASARQAIAERNVVLAEHALDEAREIRADAPELTELLTALARLQRAQGPTVWRRAAGALTLFAAGVAIFVGLDATRITTTLLPVVAPPPPVATQPLTRPPVRWDLVMVDDDDSSDEDVADEVAVPARRAAELTRAINTRRASADVPPARPDAPRATPEQNGRPNSATSTNTAAEIDHDETTPEPSLSDLVSAPARLGPAPALAVMSSPASVVPAAAVDRTAVDQTAVADVLRRYARAYGDLDVSAAREVWPNVDQRALARAFGGLSSQSVSFENCQIDVAGTTANASCRGKASYVGKVGGGEPRTEPRTWRFELKREGDSWKIANAEARRTSG